MTTSLTPADLKKWMKLHNKTEVDVSSLSHVSIRTVQRFLKGETEASPLVLAALDKMIKDGVS